MRAPWTSWRGGRLVPVYKKKDAAEDCDNSHGILLADHSGKALAGIVKEAIDPAYQIHVPATQFGAVRRRGTNVASHPIRSAIDVTKLHNLSVFVLFVDLVKAFDKVVRQLVWFSIEDLDTAVAPKTSGRQGCNLGALTFNSLRRILPCEAPVR